MIIFGTTARHKTIKRGEFFCPHCQQQRPYDHKQGKNYFSLYFIPVFPIGDAGEFIECQRCGRSYGLEVLAYKPSAPRPDAARFLQQIKHNLERGYAIEYIVAELTQDGMDRDVAWQMIEKMLAGKTKECPNCGLTYASGVQVCWDCSASLD